MKDHFIWRDPVTMIEALAIERSAYAAADADRRRLQSELDDAREKLARFQLAEDDALKQAEHLVRPYLTTAGVFGITPSHTWRNRQMDPVHLVSAIAAALAVAKLTPE